MWGLIETLTFPCNAYFFTISQIASRRSCLPLRDRNSQGLFATVVQGLTLSAEVIFDGRYGNVAQMNDSLLIAFAVANTKPFVQANVSNPKIADFGHAAASSIKHLQQCPVAPIQ